MHEGPAVTATKLCWNCEQVRPIEAFQKTRRGAARADCCRTCVEALNARFRHQRGQSALAASQDRPRANRPQMRQCRGCGDTLPTRDFWYYYIRVERLRRADKVKRPRSNFCQPCTRLRAIERPCEDCGTNKRTSEFETDREHTTPHCRDCREKRTREKRCPRCQKAKPLTGFNVSYGRPSGWCKQCNVERQRERRAEARAEKG
jgi:hypothetical protein